MDVAGLVAIAAIAETVKADIEDVRWETQRKVAHPANSHLRSAAALAGVVVLLPHKGSYDSENAPSRLNCLNGRIVACLAE